MNGLFSSITHTFQNFWSVVVDVWTHGLWGINIGQILLAFLIFLAFVASRRLFVRPVLKQLRFAATKTGLRVSEAAEDALEPPIRFIPVVIGLFFAVQYLALEGTMAEIGDRLVRSLVAIVIFWGLHNLVDPLSFLLGRLERVFSSAMVEWLVKAVRIGLILIGAATVLEIWGIEIGPVLAGLGLVGVAVALGAQDLFKNLIGGVLILAERRFTHGEWINVEGVVEGFVESIGFRSTVIRRFDRAPVYVPNARFADGAVINFSQMTHRRIFWKVGVLYSTTVEQLRQIRDGIEKYLLDHHDQFAPPSEVPTFVRIDSFNDSSIDIMVYCFTRTTKWGDWLEIKERLAYHIKEVVEGAGSAFAFPSRSLYFETPAGEAAEAFVPPKDGEEELSSQQLAAARPLDKE